MPILQKSFVGGSDVSEGLFCGASVFCLVNGSEVALGDFFREGFLLQMFEISLTTFICAK